MTSKDTIFEHLEWVLEKSPEIGLSLFINKPNKQARDSASGSDNRASSISQSASGISSNSGVGGVLDDLTYEQILEYLKRIEGNLEQATAGELNLISQRNEKKLMFPYRERYLEYIVSLGEKAENSDRY